jgi:eukaryotic-like serine/threonine-protein kinase
MTDEMTGEVLFDRYQVLEQLKAGRFRVFKVEDTYLPRIVVLKTLGEGNRATYRPLLLREAQNATRLEHPNIIRVYHLDFHADAVYYIMEYADLGNLRAVMQQRPLGTEAVLRLMKQIAKALDFVHHRGWLHLDLKPSNILLSSWDGIKLTDFGWAQPIANGNRPQFLSPFGTPAYMPPEQANCEPLDTRADLYSVGVIFYEMLFGNRPPELKWDDETEAIVALTKRTGSRELATLILRCLHPQRTQRPDSVGEFVDCLEQWNV